MKKIKDIDVAGKKVLVRVDYNVPLKNGKVASTERISASIPTIKHLLENRAAVILCSHLGRPEGKKDPKYTLAVVVSELERLSGHQVAFVTDCIGPEKDKAISDARPGDLILLENVRYYPAEEENEPDFAEKLAARCDVFVNDAFSASHRAHASVVGVAKLLPSYAGLNLTTEVEHLNFLIENPPKPYLAISGGAKISDKIDFLRDLIPKIDVLLIGGAMANTFLAAEGYEVGKSLYEEDQLGTAEEITRLCEEKGVEIMLPDDVVVAKSISEKAKGTVKSLDDIEHSDMIVDIGPKTVAKYSEPIKFAATVFWNGPLGVNEVPAFARGTEAVAKIVSSSKSHSVIGGGDTLAAVSGEKLTFEFVSTAGGATLEYVAGKTLPGLSVLA